SFASSVIREVNDEFFSNGFSEDSVSFFVYVTAGVGVEDIVNIREHGREIAEPQARGTQAAPHCLKIRITNFDCSSVGTSLVDRNPLLMFGQAFASGHVLVWLKEMNVNTALRDHNIVQQNRRSCPASSDVHIKLSTRIILDCGPQKGALIIAKPACRIDRRLLRGRLLISARGLRRSQICYTPNEIGGNRALENRSGKHRSEPDTSVQNETSP